MQNRRLFWLRFLRGGCLYVLVTGLLPLLAVFEATQEPWRLFFDALTWPIDQAPATLSAGERQLSAILGGVLCGWAFLLYKLAHPSVFSERIRQLMVFSVVLWFVLDSGGSILADLPLNALSNLSFAAILLLPLWKLKGLST